ncbi:MAG: hypothetical protein JWR21_3613 [Herminiimonas sp.]|nr:hypothetical protein [Herminiimonas sp.]
MAIENFFDSASSVMTAVSFTAFLGILWWVFIHKRSADFDAVARLPFADEEDLTAGASALSAAASMTRSTTGPASSPAARPAVGADVVQASQKTEARHG